MKQVFAAITAIMASTAVSALLLACGGPAQPPRTETVAVVPSSASDPGSPALSTTADAGATAPADAGQAVASSGPGTGPGGEPPKLCGCKLCAPVVSNDDCNTDADCAPASACHATACMAASKVQPTTTRPICTRILMCGTTDANACTCLQHKCALTPR